MKRITFLILVAGLCLPGAQAKNINVPTCSQSDFEHAYYVDSAPGDTIILPAGSGIWGDSTRANAGVIYIITNVTVIGQGDSTVITLADNGPVFNNGVIALWAAATFKSMKFVQPDTHPTTTFNISQYDNPATGINFEGGFRISDITFIGGLGLSGSGGYFAYVDGSIKTGGLFDHIRFHGNAGNTELIFGRGRADSWILPDTMGKPENIFIEDCTYVGDGYICDANANSHFVIRFNSINDGLNGAIKVDGHGVASNSPARSVRNMEVYDNHWIDDQQFGAAIEMRGGTFMIFDNVSNNTHGVNGHLFFLTDYGYIRPWPNFAFVYQVPPDFYPIAGQVGVGQDPLAAHSQPAYIWNNRKNGAPWARTFKESMEVVTGTTDSAGYPIGSTSITLTSLSGESFPGNGIAFAGDNHRYFIADGNIFFTGSATPVVIQIPAPGLLQAIPAAPTVATLGVETSYQKRSGNPTATFGDALVIQSNRDFYADAGFDTNTGVSTGTKAAMNALTPGVVGYGFWVTDEGNWNTTRPANSSGRLYTWTGSAWVLKYEPYTYPHPLQTGATTVVAPAGRTVSVLIH